MARGKAKTVTVSGGCKWMKANLRDDVYIGYYANGESYIDTQLVAKEFRKVFNAVQKCG